MKKRKNALTLLEIMIVIALITLVTGVIGYNMRGSLDKGRAFRTEQAMEQLHDLLLLAVAEGASPAQAVTQTVHTLNRLGLARNADKLIKDGWGNRFTISYNPNTNDFTIESPSYNRYKNQT